MQPARSTTVAGLLLALTASSGLAAGPEPARPEPAPPPAERLAGGAGLARITAKIGSRFAGPSGRRVYIQTDKPIYRPGDTIWALVWDLATRDLDTAPPGADARGESTLQLDLIGPDGASLQSWVVSAHRGRAPMQLDLPRDAPGGSYTLRATFPGRPDRAERHILISQTRPPALLASLELLRRAHGPGDPVTAALSLKGPTGAVLPQQPFTALLQVGGAEVSRARLQTDADGNASITFTMPPELGAGDALLTVLFDRGGHSESVTRVVPVARRRLELELRPEGGKLVAGLPSRVYLRARTPTGRPADVAGRILDARGAEVATFETLHDGMARFDLTPQAGQRYVAELTRPAGQEGRWDLPPAAAAGCVLRTYDDFDGVVAALRVGVRCSSKREVVVVATLREQLLDAAQVASGAASFAVVHLQPGDPALARAQGVARVTVFDTGGLALAERLVYRNRRARLAVEVVPAKTTFAPRERVPVVVRTRDASGHPVAARLAVAAVDEGVLGQADDEQGDLAAAFYLESELLDRVERPGYYLDPEAPGSGEALDLLMGTAGWRRLETVEGADRDGDGIPDRVDRCPAFAEDPNGVADWDGCPDQGIASPAMARRLPDRDEDGIPDPWDACPDEPESFDGRQDEDGCPERQLVRLTESRIVILDKVYFDDGESRIQPRSYPVLDAVAEAMRDNPQIRFVRVEGHTDSMGTEEENTRISRGRAEAVVRYLVDQGVEPVRLAARGYGPTRPIATNRTSEGRAKNRRVEFRIESIDRNPATGTQHGAGWVPTARATVRVFPEPVHDPELARRTDFRETVYWEPDLQTDERGEASFDFVLSDAVTAFRIDAQGVGGGLAGHGAARIATQRPLTLEVAKPESLVFGDRLALPVTLVNGTDESINAELTIEGSEAFRIARPLRRELTVAAKASRGFLLPVEAIGSETVGVLRLRAKALGLTEERELEIPIGARGFPRVDRYTGFTSLGTSLTHDLKAKDRVGPGRIRLHVAPNALARVVAGAESLLREPTGCFEQTTSKIVGNILAAKLLQARGGGDPLLIRRVRDALARSLARLSGYEIPGGGYEWFGEPPAHEAVTAFGLMMLMDLREVAPELEGVDATIARTASWLRSRRDGEGGYLRDRRQGYGFGQADPAVVDLYVTWSLVRAGVGDLDRELERVAAVAADNPREAWLLAVAARTLSAAGGAHAKAGRAAAQALLALQLDDGSFKAGASGIARSAGHALQAETTALALLALMDLAEQDGAERRVPEAIARGMGWLGDAGVRGWFGSTQATAYALAATARYADRLLPPQGSAILALFVDGRDAGRVPYRSDASSPVELVAVVPAGGDAPSVEIRLEGDPGTAVPYQLTWEWESRWPAPLPADAMKLAVEIGRQHVPAGEPVRLAVSLTSPAARPAIMPLLRLGIPGGLSPMPKQLDGLRESGQIAAWETRPGELVLYLRGLEPGGRKSLPLDLVATTPGNFTARASRLQAYYDRENAAVAAPISVEVTGSGGAR